MTHLDARVPTRVPTETLTRLAGLGLGDDPLEHLGRLVADDLAEPGARVLTVDVEAHPYDRPALTTAARFVVSGTAVTGVTGPARPRRFTYFVKLVQAWARSPLSAHVPEPLRSQLAPMVPWRTEPEIYRGDLGARLPRGLGLPRAHLVRDLDDASAVIWLEHVPADPAPWSLARYRRAAYLLGRLAASAAVAPLAVRVPVARTPRRFAETWLTLNVAPDLRADETWRRPVVAATFDPALRRRILRALEDLPALVAELESLPVRTAHGDACPDNLLVGRRRPEGRDDSPEFTLIDFGFWGTASVGFDLGQLALGEIQLGRRPADQLPTVGEVCLAGYVEGLRAEGDLVPAGDVRRAFALMLTIFHAFTCLPFEHRAADPGPEQRVLYANRAATARYVLDLLDASGVR